MKQIRGIIFDFNGTLFFDSRAHILACKEYYRKYNLPVPDDSFIAKNFFGKSNVEIYLTYYNPAGTVAEGEQFALEKEGLYQQIAMRDPDSAFWAPHAIEMLDELKARGIPFCMATGSGIENIVFYKEKLGTERWFDDNRISYMDGTIPGKPAPDVYIRAAAKMGLTPEECVLFEDGTPGLTGANRAHMGKTVAIFEDWLPSPLSGEAKADKVIHDFSNWKNILTEYGVL